MKTIKSIEKGSGEGSTFFKVNDEYKFAVLGDKIDKIKESTKEISWNCGQLCDYIRTYIGYDISGNILFEIEANASLTIIYKDPNLL
jgi:hypothetical protein